MRARRQKWNRELNIPYPQAVDTDYRNSHKVYPEGPLKGAGVASVSFRTLLFIYFHQYSGI